MRDDKSLEIVLALINQLEAELLGLKQMRAFALEGVELQMLESVIENSETKLAEIKRKVIQ
ncbi:MAG: hypothetical protein DMG78_04885 [Acidobacteria bacterium]|nr:MAG: hypothetical protein DMG78_04885 [Acidobacteriota bacterium]